MKKISNIFFKENLKDEKISINIFIKIVNRK